MENKSLKPKIRFKGFTDAWEQRKVGDICSISTGKSNTQDKIDDGKYPFYVRSEIVEHSNRYLYDEEAVLTVGDGVGTGKVFHYVNGKYDLHQRVYRCYGFSEDISAKYFYYYFSKNFYDRVMQMTAKTSVDSVRYEMIADMDFIYPSLEEQIKIVSELTKIDNLITLHQSKYDKLVNVKKALLEKMFPKDGKNVPEIRFKGFTDTWEQRKLNELTNIITKGTTPLDKVNEGTINFIKIENIDSFSGNINITSKITEEEHNSYLKRSQLKENDLLFSIAGTLGRVTVVKSDILPANTNQALAIIRLKDGDINYIKTYLKGKTISNFIKRNPTIGAQPNLSLEQVGNFDIDMPNKEEQRKLGNLFQQIDNLITLHQRKLEKLQNIKKSLLNKMFV